MLQKWPVLEEFVKVLNVTYKATIQLQSRALTLSDAYGVWLTMKLHLERKYQTNIAKYLLDATDSREHLIFKNPLMSTAMFLDPTYRKQILRDEVLTQEAIRNLVNLWSRINYTEFRAQDDGKNNTSTASIDSGEFDPKKAMQNFLEVGSEAVRNIPRQIDIQLTLELFEPGIKDTKSIIEYWETAKEDHPELYCLASVIFAISPTEVENERNFSHLNHVLNNRRTNLDEFRLKDIMFFHLNPDLFYAVRNDEINAILKKN